MRRLLLCKLVLYAFALALVAFDAVRRARKTGVRLASERPHLLERPFFTGQLGLRARQRGALPGKLRFLLCGLGTEPRERVPAGLHARFRVAQLRSGLRFPRVKRREYLRAALFFGLHAALLLHQLLLPRLCAPEQRPVLRTCGSKGGLCFRLPPQGCILRFARGFTSVQLLCCGAKALLCRFSHGFTAFRLLFGCPQPSCTRQRARSARRRAARHRAARLDDLAVEGDDAEAVSARTRERQRRIHILAHDRAREQAAHDRAVCLIKLHQRVRRTAAAAFAVKSALSERRRTDGVERQKGRPSAVRAAQVFDARPAVLGRADHDRRCRCAERGVYRGDKAVFRRKERRNRPVHARKPAAPGLLHDRSDRPGKAVIIALHIAQHGRAVSRVGQRALCLPQRRAEGVSIRLRLPQRGVCLAGLCLRLPQSGLPRGYAAFQCGLLLLYSFQAVTCAFERAMQIILLPVHSGQTSLRGGALERKRMLFILRRGAGLLRPLQRGGRRTFRFPVLRQPAFL